MSRTVPRFVPAALALAAALAAAGTAQAQFRFGGRGFYRSPGFTQAGVFGNHLRSIGFSRNPGNVIGAIGSYNYLYGGGGGGGGVSLDAGAVSELMKAQSEAYQKAQQAKQEKKDRQKQVFEERQREQA